MNRETFSAAVEGKIFGGWFGAITLSNVSTALGILVGAVTILYTIDKWRIMRVQHRAAQKRGEISKFDE